MKEINQIRKKYQNIRKPPAILGNETFILLYPKFSKNHARSDTPRYQSENHNLVSGPGQLEKSLEEINRIGKSYNNVRITHAVLKNGTFIRLYSEVPKYRTLT